jgi:Zn-dependent oligopeptidase
VATDLTAEFRRNLHEETAARERRARHAVDEARLQQFFVLDRVIGDGLFAVAEALYGLAFVARDDLPRPDPDMRVWAVTDADGSDRGLLYLDPFARDGKQGGACGQYAGAHYAYLWSAVLEAIALQRLDAQGGLTRTNGQRLREALLSRGAVVDPIGAFRAITGREPSVGPCSSGADWPGSGRRRARPCGRRPGLTCSLLAA